MFLREREGGKDVRTVLYNSGYVSKEKGEEVFLDVTKLQTGLKIEAGNLLTETPARVHLESLP